MNNWRRPCWVLTWLVAPGLFVAGCGQTQTDGSESAAGAATAGGTSSSSGGKTSKPTPTGGVVGRAGSEPAPEAGAGGVTPGIMLPPGISDMPKTAMCGIDKCASASVGPVFVDPCCAGASCGLDTGFLALVGATFEDKCQAKDQPGALDDNCPASPASAIPFPSGGQTIVVPINGFAGCCRDDGRCGVVVDAIVSPALGTVATLGLGCVDSAPFFDNRPPASCGYAGAGGAGQAVGAGPIADAGAPSGGAG